MNTKGVLIGFLVTKQPKFGLNMKTVISANSCSTKKESSHVKPKKKLIIKLVV